MRRLSHIRKILLVFISAFFLSAPVFAASVTVLNEQDHFYLDKTQLIDQQIGLLKKRFTQATQELSYLQHQREQGFAALTSDQASKYLLYKTGLHIASAKSNLDSINIELTDSQQAMDWLEKNIQEVENQLNALNIFGLKLIQGDVMQSQGLRSELKYQGNLLQLEKTRAGYLLDLQKTETTVLQMHKERYAQINAYLKSRKMLQIKERQVKSELEFQEQQNYWLRQLDTLYAQMKSVESKLSHSKYVQLEGEIFYANEQINLVYLKTLIARYKDQIRQMRLSIAHTNSISFLNSLTDQAQSLGKQIGRLDDLINNRVGIIKKRHGIYAHENEIKKPDVPALPGADKFPEIEAAYQDLHNDIANLSQHLSSFRSQLEKAIQHELSARQGLPGFSSHAWLDLGKEVLLVPTLSFQLIKGFAVGVLKAAQRMTLAQAVLLLVLQTLWIATFYVAKQFLRNVVNKLSQPENFVISLKHLLSSFLLRNLVTLGIISNAMMVFYCLSIPAQQFDWLTDLVMVWLFFKVTLVLARICLVETMHDGKGYDVQLYRRLRPIFICGVVITVLTVFLHQLPLVYEVKDLFDRLFLLLLLIVSVLILRSWRVIPSLFLQYIDSHRNYVRKMIYFLGVFLPLLLFVNSLIGLFGFVNLVWMISSYEGTFILVLVTCFFVRGLLSDGMEALSNLMIRHVSNGWLWTEAILKPVHKILQLALFLAAGMMLFLIYRWDQQSPVVERLNKLLLYPIVQVLNSTITPVDILKLLLVISLFYWAARWTREFVFRLLLSKTRDLGVRNSIAILSQYAMVVIGLLICLRVLGINILALTAVASMFAFGIGMGLRDLANNFVSGLLLLVERPVRVGDIVSVSNYEGKVTHIGGRAVTIRTWDHMDVLVPNTEIFNKSFTNWTMKDDIVRTVITIKIDRQDNPQDVQTIIHDVLKSHKEVLREPEVEVFLKDMIDSYSEFEVRYFINVRQVASRVSVRSDVLLSLWNAFVAHGVKAPNLQHEVILKHSTPLLPAPSG